MTLCNICDTVLAILLTISTLYSVNSLNNTPEFSASYHIHTSDWQFNLLKQGLDITNIASGLIMAETHCFYTKVSAEIFWQWFVCWLDIRSPNINHAIC